MVTPLQQLLPPTNELFLEQCKKLGHDPSSFVTDRIRIRIFHAQLLGKTTMTRGQLWDLNLECFVYPLPKWIPSEREMHGV